MSWKEFFLKLAHDYRPIIAAFVAGWHIKQPRWMRPKSKEEG